MTELKAYLAHPTRNYPDVPHINTVKFNEVSMKAARHWVINHLDMSYTWDIECPEIDT